MSAQAEDREREKVQAKGMRLGKALGAEIGRLRNEILADDHELAKAHDDFSSALGKFRESASVPVSVCVYR